MKSILVKTIASGRVVGYRSDQNPTGQTAINSLKLHQKGLFSYNIIHFSHIFNQPVGFPLPQAPKKNKKITP